MYNRELNGLMRLIIRGMFFFKLFLAVKCIMKKKMVNIFLFKNNNCSNTLARNNYISNYGFFDFTQETSFCSCNIFVLVLGRKNEKFSSKLSSNQRKTSTIPGLPNTC